MRKSVSSRLEEEEVQILSQKGIVSLQEGAHQAQVTIYQMMEFLEMNKIFPPHLIKKTINVKRLKYAFVAS